jgi:hypothetical protein
MAFDFGKPEEVAALHWDNALAFGPGLAEVPLDEMDEAQLRNALTYAYMALQEAYQSGYEGEVIQILKTDYDEVFRVLAGVSEEFREVVEGNRHQFAGPRTKENVSYYKKLAREASES